jgi:hypothetical protein
VRFGGGLWKKAGHLLSHAALTYDLGRARTAGKRHLKIFGSPSAPVPDPGRIIGQRGRWMQCAGLRPARRGGGHAPGASHAGGLVCRGGPLPAWRLGAAVTLGGMSKLHRRLYGEAARRADIFGFETLPYRGFLTPNHGRRDSCGT